MVRNSWQLKKPKLKPVTVSDEEEEEEERIRRFAKLLPPPTSWNENEIGETNSWSRSPDLDEQEEALIALINHRTSELDWFRSRINHYQNELYVTEKKLHDLKSQLARIRIRRKGESSQSDTMGSSLDKPQVHKRCSPVYNGEGSSHHKHQSKPKLIIPAVPSCPTKFPVPRQRPEYSSIAGANLSSTRPFESPMQNKSERSYRKSPNHEANKSQATGAKRKMEYREHKDLIPLVATTSSPRLIHCDSSTHISSQHTRKLRCLSLCPINDKLFITSALDGIINSWQLQTIGSGATLLNSTNCLSPKERKWPEDIAWHPVGNMLFAVYAADGGANQISVIDLNKTNARDRLTFLEHKPHVKGLINSIMFMPWDDPDVYFATGGSDHCVVLWKDNENDMWKPNVLHKHLHSSAVTGVTGLQQKKIVLSVGSDKKIIGYNVDSERIDFTYQIETRCMSVLPNPCDINLFMVQTGAPERQLRLYDIRLRQTEIHTFGWKQECSESQSARIHQAWSPDGLHITTGSADPKIHIFDVRYNANKPCQSLQAHQKRVFKAVWHSSVPLLTSISSDLNLGFHHLS